MVGKLIREARSNLGLTYEELAILCEMTPRYLQRIEEGKVAKPHVKTLKVVSDYLKLDFHQLMESCGYLKPDLPEKTLAALVRSARLHKGYSQENLARLCGMCKQTLVAIERGKSTKPQPITMKKLADYLDLELDEVMKNSGYQYEREEKTLADIVRNARLHKGYS